jgi:hypothetical protein
MPNIDQYPATCPGTPSSANGECIAFPPSTRAAERGCVFGLTGGVCRVLIHERDQRPFTARRPSPTRNQGVKVGLPIAQIPGRLYDGDHPGSKGRVAHRSDHQLDHRFPTRARESTELEGRGARSPSPVLGRAGRCHSNPDGLLQRGGINSSWLK